MSPRTATTARINLARWNLNEKKRRELKKEVIDMPVMLGRIPVGKICEASISSDGKYLLVGIMPNDDQASDKSSPV